MRRIPARGIRGLAAATALLFVLVLAAPPARASDALLNPPHADVGLDTDGDTLFNFLEINVSLTVTVGGPFDIFVDLYDNTGFNYITGNGAFVVLGVGPAVVSVDVPGLPIFNSGFNGPYTADIWVYDDMFNLDDFGTHMTGPYLFTEFETPGASFAPPHSDLGIDTDANTLFNFLRVNAMVDVSQAGDYELNAYLFDSSFNFIGSAFVPVTLSVGPGQTIPVDFQGWSIRANGIDGPYFVDLYLYEAFGPFLDNDLHTTLFYAFTAFEMPPALLTPPHADSGVDTDGDALFNAIEIAVSLQVDVPGDYNLQVTFWDSGNTTWLGTNNTFMTLGSGPQTVPVWMPTLNLVVQGIDGPYNVVILLFDAFFNQMDLGWHGTAGYTIPEFDPIPAQFAPPHWDAGEDRDSPPDGLFNMLRIDVNFSVADAGSFLLAANLWDAAMTVPIDSQFQIINLNVGPQTVPVYFSGITIRNSGIDGPYVVDMQLISFPGFFLIDTDMHTTAASYLAADFQSVIPETLSGTVRDSVTSAGIPFANVIAIDYANALTLNTFADNMGVYSLGVHQGSWVVIFDEFAYDAALTPLTVTGPATLNYDLDPVTPELRIGNVTLGTWTTLDLGFEGFFQTDIVLLRWQLDWFLGNRDQNLSQAEWDVFLQLGGFTPPTPQNSTWDMFLTDSKWYEFVPGSDWFQIFDAPGPIGSTVPMRMEVHATYTNGTIAPSPAHTILANLTYDTPMEDFRFNVMLPPGYVLASYVGTPDFTITGLLTGTAMIDPGPDPNPADLIDSAWIQLNVNTPDGTNPTVGSPTASPNPVVSGNQLTISAQVSDNTGVAEVRLQVWNPSGGLSVNVTMADSGGGNYQYPALFPTTLGDWTFTVTATDFAGNTASRSGSFRVIELNAPTISATSATPSPQEFGQAVLLAATVTDDTALATVTVEVRAGATVLGNFTMVFNATSGNYEYAGTFLQLGSHTYTVWATDTFDNVASAGGAFTIVDTTDPVLMNAADTPDPVEVGSTVRISVTATDSAGFASVTVQIRDPSAAIVGTFPMTTAGGGAYQYDFSPTELGTYSYNITATDAGGNTASVVGTFLSRDTTNPIANAGPDQTVNVGVVVTFDGRASSDNDVIATYTWTFEEGGQTRTRTGSQPNYTFATAGVYLVTLQVEDASGNTHVDTVTITVQAPGTPAPGSLPWLYILVIVIAGVVVGLAVWFMKRKKATPTEPLGMPPTESPPQEGLPPPPE